MTTRRGFLGAILAAGVAPGFVMSGITRGVLMPVKPAIEVVPAFTDITTTIEEYLGRGELGSYDSFRFIESRELPKNLGDRIRVRRPLPYLTAAMLNAAWLPTERYRVREHDGQYLAFVHPSRADDLRRAGLRVDKG